MTALLSFEALKLRIRWMPRIILVLLLVPVALSFWGQGSSAHTQPNLFLPRGWLAALVFASFFAPFAWPLLAGSWAGNEYGWGTIRLILTRRPSRVQHMLAALAVLVFAAGAGLLTVIATGTAAGALVAILTGHNAFLGSVVDRAFLGSLMQTFLAAWYVATFFLLLAYAAASVFGSATAGVGISIGVTLAQFIGRGIVDQLGGVWKEVGDRFPITYANDLVLRTASPGLRHGAGLGIETGAPGAAEALLAITLCCILLLVLTLVTVRSRDVTA